MRGILKRMMEPFGSVMRFLDRQAALRVVRRDGQSTVLHANHDGMRVKVLRDAFSWCSGHEFFLCVQDWETGDKGQWVCIGGIPRDGETFEARISERKEALEKEHEILLSWGLVCKHKYTEYILHYNKEKDLCFIREGGGYGTHMSLVSDFRNGNRYEHACTRVENGGFADGVYAAVCNNSTFFGLKTEEIRKHLSGAFDRYVDEKKKAKGGL